MSLIYLDNAATTKIDDQVVSLMQASMISNYGNPSSSHQIGRKAKSAIETARKNIAKHFNVSASEFIFTAGGTEADTLILHNAVANLGVTRIISSKIEHHAVLHSLEHLAVTYNIELEYVQLNEFGAIDEGHLASLLQKSDKKTLVSLMHINNEIGTMLDLDNVATICAENNALFHSDTVQTIGHYGLDLQKTPVDFITASAHKFHGPKGVGFAFFRKGFGISPMIHGGSQEKGARAGTENVHAILGMEKAISLAYHTLESDVFYMNELKAYFSSELTSLFPGILFNGQSDNIANSSCSILSVRFPFKNEMLLFHLDLAGIAASGGSACQSGSAGGSHVLAEILDEHAANTTSVRFSFSRFTKKQELNTCLEVLQKITSK